MLFLSVEDHFDSAHYLMAYEGQCSRMHGHRWVVRVSFGPFADDRVSGNNMIVDFKDLRQQVGLLTSRLDHQILNEVLNVADPTAEHIVLWFAKELKAAKLKPARIDVFESPEACASWMEGEAK